MFGYSTAEMIGQSLEVLTLPIHHESVEQSIRLALESREGTLVETLCINKNGCTVWVSWSFTPCVDSAHAAAQVLLIGHD
ncbi:MAG TPA: PAS domain-containing protein [Limnobacter sp.]|uniref:PAS domain-containing protein n=1 Tax=Limnobacter sp. TaxID=2003368 RepID=UPI002ED9E727